MEFTSEFPEYLKFDQQIASEANIALFNASLSGNVKEVAKLLKTGEANPNYFYNPADSKNSLMVASEIGSLEIVNLLLTAGAVPNALNLGTRYSSLQYAVVRDHVEVARLLLSNGAYIDHQNAYGNTAIHIAASEGSIKCLDLLDENTKGFLLFVTPDNIMTGNTGKAYEEIIKFNTHVIDINNIQKTHFPGIGQSMCYFLVEKSKKQNNFKTTIINQKDDKLFIELQNRPVNPIRNWTNETEKLILKYITKEENAFKRTSDDDTPPRNDNGNIIVIESAKREYKTNDQTSQGYKVPKYILFRMSPTHEGKLDLKGNYGLYAQIYFIPIKGINVKKLQGFFSSEDYKLLVNSITTSQYLKDSFVKHIDMGLFSSAIKIQAVVRGRQTRKKIKENKAIQTITKFISRHTRTKKGGSKSPNRKTRKMR